MAIVRVSFDGGECPDRNRRYAAGRSNADCGSVATGFASNQPFIVAEGFYCFGLQTAFPYTPLWQMVQAIDGEEAEISFQRLS